MAQRHTGFGDDIYHAAGSGGGRWSQQQAAEPEMKCAIAMGDIVALRSAPSVYMTAGYVEPRVMVPLRGDRVETVVGFKVDCVWFSTDQKLQRDTFDAGLLVKVS